VCGYTCELDLMFYKKEILHFSGLWKMVFFLRLRATPILVDHEVGCIGKNIHIKNIQMGGRMCPVH
jgi:hypothetical protein